MRTGKLVQYCAFAAVVIGLFALWNHQTNGMLKQLHSSESVVVTSAAVAATPAINTGGVLPNNEAERIEAAQKRDRREAEDAQTARILKSLKPVTINPKPVPTTESQHWYVPKGSVPSGRMYGNRDLKPAANPAKAPPDVRVPVLIVDIDPAYGTSQLDLRDAAADKRLGCAAYSYQPDPKSPRRVNRIYCGQ